MSLGGLTLGIGLLVDNSIVVLEAIQRRRDEGLSEVAAAEAGASEVGRAVVASTLTTICVFVPIVFVEGVAGQLFGDQALTVTFSLLVSLIVALTVIPMLASRRLGDPDPPGQNDGVAFRAARGLSRALLAPLGLVARAVQLLARPPLAAFSRAFEAFARAYRAALSRALDHPLATALIALGVLASSLLLLPTLGQELIPELVQGEFYVELELPPGTHLDVTERTLARLEAAAARLPGIDRIYTLAGTSQESGGVAGELRENVGQLTFLVSAPVDRDREEALMADLRTLLEAEPHLSYRFARPSYFSFGRRSRSRSGATTWSCSSGWANACPRRWSPSPGSPT